MIAHEIGDEICTLRIELADTEPRIWRELEVPTSVTLKTLHQIVQAAMGWGNYHLWEFKLGRQRFATPHAGDWGSEKPRDAGKVQLHELLSPSRTQIDYLYDFGDDWLHHLTVSRIRPAEAGVAYPRYIGGERNAPPEDCGGTPGFYNKLDILADQGHPDHEDIVEWLGSYDPGTVDVKRIEAALKRIAKRLSTAKTKSTKPPGNGPS